MPEITPKLGLKKPLSNDNVTRESFNENWQILDDNAGAPNGIATLGPDGKVPGGQLSTEVFTFAEKTKLSEIAAGANNYVHPDTHPATIIAQTATHRLVSDTQISNWNAKETTEGAQAKVNAHANLKTNPHAVTKAQVGLGNVDDVKQASAEELATHQADEANPHKVTKAQVGLPNVDDTKQMPISGGAFTGMTTAYSNTSYAVRQVRNMILSPNDAVAGSMQNGDIWVKYK